MNKIQVLEKLDKFSGIGFGVSKEDFEIENDSLIYAGMPVGFDAISMAAKWATIPTSFFSRVPVDLQAQLLNRMFSEVSGYPKFIHNDNQILAFTHPSADILDTKRIVDTLDSSLTGAEIDRVYSKGGSVEIYAHGPREHSVVKNDIVMGGIWLKFSPIAEINPEITGYMYRLVCTNGMIRPQEFARFSYSRGGDPYEWIGEYTYNLYSKAEEEVLRYREMRETKLNGNLSATLNHLISDLPKDIQSVIKDHIMNKKPENMYDLMNEIAYFATHKLEEPKHVWDTMAVSGRAVEHADLCPVCHSVM